MKYIFLHGLGQTSDSWKATIEHMNINTDILTPNLADWLQNKEVNYSSLYEMLENYCETINDDYIICGLSLGGILALHYTIAHPDKVFRLALIGTQYTMSKRLLKIQNLIFRFMPKSAFLKMGFQKSDFINLCSSMMELNFEKDLKKIQCPTLILCGEKDRANKKASLKLKELITHTELTILQDSGHEVNIDNPAELAHVLNAFFKSNYPNLKI